MLATERTYSVWNNVDHGKRFGSMADTISNTQAQHLQQLRDRLGETTFQRIQRDVWKRFSPQPPPIDTQGNLAPLALFGIWDELVEALNETIKRRAHENELTSRTQQTGGPLWEMLKNGVTWSANMDFRGERLGWEVVLSRNGQRFNVQQFVNREKAEAWADKECIEIAMGWKR